MLTKLELHNFKSHRHTEFNFDDSRLHAIVGQNSSGKTSVLQAINYLSQLSDLNLSVVSNYQKTLDLNIRFGRDELFVECHGLTGDESNKWSFSYEYNKNKYETNFVGHPQNIIRRWNINNAQFSDSDTSYQSIYSMPENRSFQIQELQFACQLKLIESNLVRASYSEQIIPEMAFDGYGLASTIDYLRSEAPEQFQSLQKMLQQVVPSVRRVGTKRAKVNLNRSRSIEVDGKKIFYEENQEVIGQEIVFDMATGDRIPASAISEGTMLTLGLLTVLMNPQQPNLVLLDDIEQGLHPKAQRELITVFKQIIRDNPNLQIIFTTHSPYIIDELEPSQVHVLSNSKDGFTHTKRLDEHPDIEWAKQTLTTGEFWDAEGEDWVVEAEEND